MDEAMRSLRQAGPVGGLLAMAALTGVVVAASWLLLDAPHVACGIAPPAGTGEFRREAIALHVVALLALGAVVARMSELRSGAGVGGRTRQGLAGAGAAAVACLLYHPLFGLLALPGLLSIALTGPLAILAATLAAAWALTGRRPLARRPSPSPLTVGALAWVGIALLLPGHLALVLLQSETLFCF
jgi:hypothetical protein